MMRPLISRSLDAIDGNVTAPSHIPMQESTFIPTQSMQAFFETLIFAFSNLVFSRFVASDDIR
jgi:hypothetical protein